MMNNNDNDGQRQNQISWQQFSNQIRGAENARAEYLEECRSKRRDEEEAKFVDVEVSTPRRQASSSSGGIGTTRRAVVKFQLAAPPAVVEEEKPTTTSHYEVVQKPKTRAARRAMEEAELEEEVTTTTTDPRPKRERRIDYWVERDSKRRGDARTFKMKMTAQLAVGGE
jgi:hypothetical protein